MAGRGPFLVARRQRQRDAPALGDGDDLREHPRDAGLACCVVRPAQIEAELHLAGNDVDRTRLRLDPADGADHARRLARDAFHREDHLGRCRERILAEGHRHRAGVAGLARDAGRDPLDRGDRGHDAKWLVRAFEHRPLLDVKFDVAQHRLAPPGDGGNRRGVEPEGGHRLAHGDAGLVAALQRCHVEGAGDGTRAGEGHRKAHAFLVAECDHLDGEGQLVAETPQLLDHREAREHAEIAVIFAGIAHRIDMRGDDQRRQTRLTSFQPPDDVANRIDGGREPGLREPALHFLHPQLVRGREIEPGQLAGFVSDQGQFVEARHHACGGGKIGNRGHFWVLRASTANRASLLRSASEISVMLFGGMARLSTA